MSSVAWVVVVEWEGQKPPTTFYRYVRKILAGIRKRGKKKDMSAKAVWVQEGVYVVTKREVAGLIAALAEHMGAKVWFFIANLTAPTAEECMAAQWLVKYWRKRGRKRNNPPGGAEGDIARALRLAALQGSQGSEEI